MNFPFLGLATLPGSALRATVDVMLAEVVATEEVLVYNHNNSIVTSSLMSCHQQILNLFSSKKCFGWLKKYWQCLGWNVKKWLKISHI